MTDWTNLIVALAALGPSFIAFLAYKQAKGAKYHAGETHRIANAEHTLLIEEIRQLKQEIQHLTTAQSIEGS